MTEGPRPEPGWDQPTDKLPRQIVAVFAQRADADRAVEALQNAGIDRKAIRVGARADRRSSLMGEMRDESDHAMIGAFGAMSRESTAGAGLMMAIGVVIGGCIGLLLSLIPFGMSWGWRAILLGCIGAAVGVTAGFIAGAGVLSKGPARTAAASSGVTLAVEPATADAVRVLRARNPVRLDLLTSEGDTLGPVGPSHEPGVGDALKDAAEHVHADPTSQSEWATNNGNEQRQDKSGS